MAASSQGKQDDQTNDAECRCGEVHAGHNCSVGKIDIKNTGTVTVTESFCKKINFNFDTAVQVF